MASYTSARANTNTTVSPWASNSDQSNKYVSEGALVRVNWFIKVADGLVAVQIPGVDGNYYGNRADYTAEDSVSGWFPAPPYVNEGDNVGIEVAGRPLWQTLLWVAAVVGAGWLAFGGPPRKRSRR